MTKRVLDVGQCGPDHAAIRSYVERNFGAEVRQTHWAGDTLAELRKGKYDLVLINHKLDSDYTDGIEILKAIKADPDMSATPVMLVTNYAEHQQQAVAAGAELGFGKLEYHKPETKEKLGRFLG